MKAFIVLGTFILIIGLLVTGCTTTQDLGAADQRGGPTDVTAGSSSGSTAAGPEVTPLSTPLKFQKGDIIGDASSDTEGWIIIDMNPATKEYKVDLIFRNDDGSWGWREFPVEEWTPQAYVEEGSSIVIAKMDPAKIRSNYPNDDAWMAGQGPNLANTST